MNRKALMKNNLRMSVGFLLAMAGIAWVYITYRSDFQWPFDFSIGACYALMILFAGVSWKSYGFREDYMEGTFAGHIRYQLRKLRWQYLVLTVFIWIYTLLLWIALMMYTLEVTRRGSLWFQITVFSITTLYIGLVSWLTRKKQRRKIDELKKMIFELEDIQMNIEAEN